MKPIQDKFPVFEANQVLTNAHLNQAINYLDEQERLTRANLIGIGIVCGLDIKFDNIAAPIINISKGCGITSEGYLIVEPSNVALVSYRDYKVPENLAYPPFNDASNTQYPLWELFPTGEPNTTQLGAVPKFLNDKVVLLFLELKKAGLRNCSPNNCDDKGTEVTATVRRLLIKLDDLKKIIAAANQLAVGLTFTDLETALLARLNLPDLRLPRYDVLNTSPVTSNQVLAAFHAVFQINKLAFNTNGALTAAYNAFKPIVQDIYPTNPFANFTANFGFLDSSATTTTQVRFLQYYYDFFDDLLRAYDEFRWKGVELMCACCPPGGLFPRHLMLGVLFPASVPNPSVYRHHFLASSAIGDCEERTKSLVLLFRRIVGMITRFTNTPPLPKPLPNFRTADNQIRITPSKLADVPLSDKAIPYYYLQDGTPPLFQLWNADKTQRVRANQNLGYRSDEYLPTAPVFVTEALRFDLEPYNFLRIEGHLGKNYQGVMQRLLTLKSQYRLPIELIVLRTGVFDETIAVDLSKEECRFQDLETLYDTLKTELTCFLCKEVQYFYSLPYEGRSTITESVKPKLPLLVQCAPDFLVKSKTLGRFFEDWLSSLPAEVIPDIDPNIIINFLNTQNAGQSIIIIFYLIIYIEKLFEQLSQNLGQLNFVNFERRYRDLVSVTEAIERDREETIGNIEGNANLLSWDELDDRLEVIIYSCHLDAFRVLQEEFKRRIKATKQKQFLSSFLKEHPGIQHKAGVPLGGTFIIVYHDDPDIIKSGRTFSAEIGLTNSLANQNTFSVESAKILSGALTRLQSSNKDCVFDPDIQLIFAELTGQIPTIEFFPIQGELATNAEKIIAETVNGFVDGAVIADFFLPYICCSDCSPVQFVLPKMPPSFNVLMGCPNVRGITLVTIIPEGGLPPYSIKVDKLEYKLLRGSLQLDVGSHTLQIRDAEGKESISQTIIVASALQISEPVFQCSEDLKTYTATFNITGGTVPYMVNGTSIKGNKYTTDSIASGTGAVIEVVDSNKCSQKREFNNSCVKPCDLPCAGIALKRGYYFNLPNTDAPRATVSVKFSFEFPQGNTIDLSTEVKAILEKVGTDKDSFAKQINLLIAEKTRSTDWLKFESILKTSEQDVLDEWQIEYFECLDFNLNIQVTSFTLSVEVPLQSVLTETVTPKTSTIVFKQGEQTLIDIKIPAFDPVKIDKCNPQIPVQKLCDNRPNLTLIISNEVDGLTAKLTANHTGNDQPIAYLWDVPGANPPLSNNPIASFTFTQIEPGTKPIRLTAFTKEGCRVILEDTITLG